MKLQEAKKRVGVLGEEHFLSEACRKFCQGAGKMKCSSILVLLFFVSSVLFLGISCNTRSIQKSSGSAYGSIRAEATHIDRGKLHSRRLREGGYGFTDKKTTKGWENVNNDDYQPVDPSPSSKATVHAGPIEHGTPLLPYVPRYTPPPGHPKHVAPAQSPASPVT